MSAFGTKQTSALALHMSAIGGKADMPFCAALNQRVQGSSPCAPVRRPHRRPRRKAGGPRLLASAAPRSPVPALPFDHLAWALLHTSPARSSPRWKASFTTKKAEPLVLGGLAEFERELIRARTDEGRKRAQARGVRFGRKLKLTQLQITEALQRKAAGEALVEIGRSYNVSHSSISRL